MSKFREVTVKSYDNKNEIEIDTHLFFWYNIQIGITVSYCNDTYFLNVNIVIGNKFFKYTIFSPIPYSLTIFVETTLYS